MLVSFDPRDTPEAAAEKKRAHSQYWSVPETRRRLALPHRRPSRDSARHVGRRVHLPVGRGDAAVRARERRPRGHARRAAVALLLRRRVLAEGAAAGARRIRAGRASARSIDELLLYCFHYDPATGGTAWSS